MSVTPGSAADSESTGAGDGSLVSDGGGALTDRVEHTAPTAVDSQGVERIVGPPQEEFVPAEVEPDPAEVERVAEVLPDSQGEVSNTTSAPTSEDYVRRAEPSGAVDAATEEEVAAAAEQLPDSEPGPGQPAEGGIGAQTGTDEEAGQ